MAGRTVLITGAARGQGAAEAALLGAEGASVVLTDVLDEAGEATAARLRGEGIEALYHRLDVSSAADWEQVVAFAEAQLGPLDVLVNNAGIVTFAGLAELTEEEWDAGISVNQSGVFLGMRAAVPSMRRASAGSIVNKSSIFGLGGVPGYFAYQASKGAVIQMTRAAAVDLAAEGIRVNCICPGLVFTEMTKTEPESAVAENIERTPLGRGAEPVEIAHGTLYLASDEASFVTGAVLPIDGGYLAQ